MGGGDIKLKTIYMFYLPRIMVVMVVVVCKYLYDSVLPSNYNMCIITIEILLQIINKLSNTRY